MKIVSAFLADHATVQNGTIYVHGGFPAFLDVPEVPVPMSVGLAVVVEFESSEEAAASFVLGIELRRSGAVVNLEAAERRLRPPERSEAWLLDCPRLFPWAGTVASTIEDVGAHEIEVYIDGVSMALVKFGVRVPLLDPV